MAFTWMMMVRYSPEGAKQVAEHGMAAVRDVFAAGIGEAPANGRVHSWYAVDDHEWDAVIIGEVENDDPAFWAKSQLVNGRATGRLAASRLLRLAEVGDFDAVDLG